MACIICVAPNVKQPIRHAPGVKQTGCRAFRLGNDSGRSGLSEFPLGPGHGDLIPVGPRLFKLFQNILIPKPDRLLAFQDGSIRSNATTAFVRT